MKIFFDIDGVLRDTNGILIKKYRLPYPTSWYANEWDKLGLNIYDLVAIDYNVLFEANPTKYFKIILNYGKNNGGLEIWSHQPPSWRPHTKKWLNKNLQGIKYKLRFLTPKQKAYRLSKIKDGLLVDDFPLFSNYDKIILVDYPYNRNVKKGRRISSPKELKDILNDKKRQFYSKNGLQNK